jgi:addiction module HigA family antidote
LRKLKSDEPRHLELRDCSISLPALPPLPSCVLKVQFLGPRNISQAKLARAMGVSRVVVNHIVHGRNAITAEMALRLGTALNTSPEYWLRLQADFDLFVTKQRLATTMEKAQELSSDHAHLTST